MEPSSPLELRPVGRVCSPVSRRKEMSVWGVPASVEIYPEFAAALHRIEKHSHLWVFAWLNNGRDERDVLQVTPRGVTDPGPEGLHGVFSVRSPARPNPIGLTVAKVLSRDGLTIHFDRLDFVDQTPVLDLKPYFVTRDLVFSAKGWPVGKPRSRDELRESLHIQATNFHGAGHPDAALAARVVEHYRVTRHDLNDPPTYSVTVPSHRPVLIDGLIGITRCTPGRGNLAFTDEDCVVINDVRYRLLPLPEDPFTAPDEALFTPASS